MQTTDFTTAMELIIKQGADLYASIYLITLWPLGTKLSNYFNLAIDSELSNH